MKNEMAEIFLAKKHSVTKTVILVLNYLKVYLYSELLYQILRNVFFLWQSFKMNHQCLAASLLKEKYIKQAQNMKRAF